MHGPASLKRCRASFAVIPQRASADSVVFKRGICPPACLPDSETPQATSESPASPRLRRAPFAAMGGHANSDTRFSKDGRAIRSPKGEGWRRRRDINTNQSGANIHRSQGFCSRQKCHRIDAVGVCRFADLAGGQLPFATQKPISERNIDPEQFRQVRAAFVAFREHEAQQL